MWKVTDAVCWPSMSDDVNVTMSKDETHEEVLAKQQKVAVSRDKTPRRSRSKPGREVVTPLYLSVIVIVNGYCDFSKVVFHRTTIVSIKMFLYQ